MKGFGGTWPHGPTHDLSLNVSEMCNMSHM